MSKYIIHNLKHVCFLSLTWVEAVQIGKLPIPLLNNSYLLTAFAVSTLASGVLSIYVSSNKVNDIENTTVDVEKRDNHPTYNLSFTSNFLRNLDKTYLSYITTNLVHTALSITVCGIFLIPATYFGPSASIFSHLLFAATAATYLKMNIVTYKNEQFANTVEHAFKKEQTTNLSFVERISGEPNSLEGILLRN